MIATPNAKHAKVRARLASDVAAFLSDGHTIEKVDYTANQGWRNRHVKTLPHLPMIVNRRNNPNAAGYR